MELESRVPDFVLRTPRSTKHEDFVPRARNAGSMAPHFLHESCEGSWPHQHEARSTKQKSFASPGQRPAGLGPPCGRNQLALAGPWRVCPRGQKNPASAGRSRRCVSHPPGRPQPPGDLVPASASRSRRASPTFHKLSTFWPASGQSDKTVA